MKFIYRTGFGAAMVLAGVIIGLQLTSQALEGPISEDQKNTIRTHCIQVKATLNQLIQNDTLLRYNIGTSYRSMSEKLMVPLNQRIAATEYDGSELVGITAEYSNAYEDFYQEYRAYNNNLQQAAKIDCMNNPEDFYIALDVARQHRITLYESSDKLVKLLEDYRTAVKDFRKEQLKEDQ